jgi:L-alanine-DL-glutamate epimerase-like enolase superfamily enzyme
MILVSLEPSVLSIPFRAAFKHASAERRETQTLWMEACASNGLVGFGEGCPREYVSAESLSSAMMFVEQHRKIWLTGLHDICALGEWVDSHRSEIDANPAAWTAVELALLDLMGKDRQCSVERLLHLPELAGRFQYTAVLGDGSPEQFASQLDRYLKTGFTAFKIKLSGDREVDRAKVKLLTEAGVGGHAVRADANNLWKDADACIVEVNSLGYDFIALEEPLQPGDYAGLNHVAQSLNTKVILDESVLREEQLENLSATPDRWIVNCRVSKMGGLLRCVQVLRSAHARGVGVIVGAHVGETSVLTRAALTVANVGRNFVIAHEGAFGTHLLCNDVADPPLMFGAGGAIDIAATGLADRPGLGLNVSRGVGG